jgi:uncharacterized protein YbjT (DUF2867 family)
MSVFVVGASGNVGRRVVRCLLDRDVAVTALLRETEGPVDPASVFAEPGVTVVRGDLRHPDAWRKSAAGCDALFVLTPHQLDQVELQNAAVDVASDIGARVVKVSSWAPAVHQDSPVPGARRHWITQQYLVRRQLPYTILYPNYFMQVLINRYADGVRRDGRLRSPAGDRGISMVDAADVAEVAARVLTEDGHDGRTYTLSGPTAPRYQEIADLLSELTDRKVTYVDLSDDEFVAWMVSEGRRQWEIDHAVAIFGLYRQGVGELVTDDVERLIGRPPREITEFLIDNRQHFLAA